MAQADLARNSDAIQTFRRAIALDPDLPGVHVMLARAHFAAGQMDDAAAALSDALRIDPYESTAWDLAGRVLTTKRAYPAAFFNFEQAIRYRPEFAPHIYDYALALSTASEFDRAETRARNAIRADPRMAEPHVLLGGLLVRRSQIDAAAAEYSEAVRLRPASARTRLEFASVLVAQGKMPQAAEQLRVAAKSDDAEAARIAASALQRLGQR
jgi:tetratricopeptide (TPR) repeat protein